MKPFDTITINPTSASPPFTLVTNKIYKRECCHAKPYEGSMSQPNICPSPFHTCPSLCCLSSLSTTWLREPLLTQAPSNLLATARWRQTIAPTLLTVGHFGALFGVALPRFFHVLGLLFTPISHARRKRTQLCRSPNTAFLYSFALCLYPSTCWHGQLGNS